MCRSIQRLRGPEGIATDEQIQAAARQFVRKVSGMREPSTRHAEAFEAAVAAISDVSRELLGSVGPTRPGSRPIGDPGPSGRRR
jgi:hypothetical protein